MTKEFVLAKGFTLIELMIVIAIIAILATFAVPAFQDYTVRTRLSEGLVLASSAKAIVVDNAVNMTGDLSKGWEPFEPTRNIKDITIDPDTGVIYVTATAAADNMMLRLMPSTISPTGANAALGSHWMPEGRIKWKCAPDYLGLDDQYPGMMNKWPAECRNW